MVLCGSLLSDFLLGLAHSTESLILVTISEANLPPGFFLT